MSAFHPLRACEWCGRLRSMRIPCLMAAMALCGCSAQAKSPHDDVMDKIERAVSLPKGANPLNDYARYYAFDDKGFVWAVYSLPGPPPSGHEVCTEMNG